MCRLEAALLTEQLRTGEVQRELEESHAEQERLRAACAAAESAVNSAQAGKASLEAERAELQAEKAELLSRLQVMDGRSARSVQDAENRLVDVQVCPDGPSLPSPGRLPREFLLDLSCISVQQATVQESVTWIGLLCAAWQWQSALLKWCSAWGPHSDNECMTC